MSASWQLLQHKKIVLAELRLKLRVSDPVAAQTLVDVRFWSANWIKSGVDNDSVLDINYR